MEPLFPFPALQRFITLGGRIAVGRIAIIDCAAIAADPETLWVVPSRREGEALRDLLKRLNDRLEQDLARNVRPVDAAAVVPTRSTRLRTVGLLRSALPDAGLDTALDRVCPTHAGLP